MLYNHNLIQCDIEKTADIAVYVDKYAYIIIHTYTSYTYTVTSKAEH